MKQLEVRILRAIEQLMNALVAPSPLLRLPPAPFVLLTPCIRCGAGATCTRGGTGPGSHRTSNGENAELYAVHPYRQATRARGDADALAKGLDAFKNKVFAEDVGWNQVAMDASLLGLAAEAAAYVVARARTMPAQGYRFPAFAPHEQDFEPSGDHFAVFQNAVQYMLIQRVDDAAESVLLLPSWPCAWDVNFTLSAPRNTTVTGSVKNGKLAFTVDPVGRTPAVHAAACQAIPPPSPPTPPPSPGPPPGIPCNRTAWHALCLPNPSNIGVCMACCEAHKAELFKLNCIGTNVWPNYCAGK